MYLTQEDFKATAEPYILPSPSLTTQQELKSTVREYVYTSPVSGQKDTLPPQTQQNVTAPSSAKKELLPPPPQAQQNATAPSSVKKELPYPVHPQQKVTKNKNTIYRVEVPGTSSKLLAKVKKVEPRAFINRKGRFIQAGLYGDVLEAHKRVKQLIKVKVTSKTVKVYH